MEITGLKIKGFINPLDESKKSADGFNDIISDFIGNVKQDQFESKKVMEDYASGGDVEIHEVMLAGEKAKTSFELLMEIRNKTVDMYKELTRMPV